MTKILENLIFNIVLENSIKFRKLMKVYFFLNSDQKGQASCQKCRFCVGKIAKKIEKLLEIVEIDEFCEGFQLFENAREEFQYFIWR